MLPKLARDLDQFLRLDREHHKLGSGPGRAQGCDDPSALDRFPARTDHRHRRQIETTHAPSIENCATHIAAADEPRGLRDLQRFVHASPWVSMRAAAIASLGALPPQRTN